MFFISCKIFNAIISFRFFCFEQTSCVRAFLGPWQKWTEGTEISHPFLVPHMHSLPPSRPGVEHLLYLINLDGHIIITQSPWFTLGFTLGFVHSVGFVRHIATRIHHYGTIRNSFPALKILCAPITFQIFISILPHRDFLEWW